MNDTPTDGGPAFPSDLMLTKGVVAAKPYGGMSLRDWFAGQALAGLLADPAWDHTPDAAPCARAFRLADAMIAARSAK